VSRVRHPFLQESDGESRKVQVHWVTFVVDIGAFLIVLSALVLVL